MSDDARSCRLEHCGAAELLRLRLARGANLQMFCYAPSAGLFKKLFNVCDQEFFAFFAVHFPPHKSACGE